MSNIFCISNNILKFHEDTVKFYCTLETKKISYLSDKIHFKELLKRDSNKKAVLKVFLYLCFRKLNSDEITHEDLDRTLVLKEKSA